MKKPTLKAVKATTKPKTMPAKAMPMVMKYAAGKKKKA